MRLLLPLCPLNADTNMAHKTPSVLELGDLRATGALQSCVIIFHWSKLAVLLSVFEPWLLGRYKALKYLVLTNSAEPCFPQVSLKDALWAVNKELLARDLHKEQKDQAEINKQVPKTSFQVALLVSVNNMPG